MYSVTGTLFHIHHIWSNFMRMHIHKKLCYFFSVNQSSLLTLIFIEIAWDFFLLLKFKLLVDVFIKNRSKDVPKRIIYLILAISFSKLYTWGSEHKYRHMRLKRVRAFLSWVRAFYRACAHFIASVHVCNNCACNCAWIFMKFFGCWLLSYELKFKIS